ncbi:hypothetical protein GJAV_G00069520 [Gymnothorax javanicus]|nr:hypothetical protein GJAV_G00069520 [Gymnothorax javanicus]
MKRWKKFTEDRESTLKVKNKDDINAEWKKRVNMASELALAKVFPKKKMASNGINWQALQSMEQLNDHDESYSEAQGLLNDWMSRKLRLELGEDEETPLDSEDSLAPPSSFLEHDKFDDLYSHLDQEVDDCAVHNVLRDLMGLEVVNAVAEEDLMLDADNKKTRPKSALVPMEIRQQLIRENRTRREAHRLKQQQERELLKEAEEKARRRVQKEQLRRRQEERKQEELLQQEVVQLRRKMEERRRVEQLARLMEREREKQDKMEALISVSPPPDLGKIQLEQVEQRRETARRLQVVQARVHMVNLRCLQKHFSKWYSAVLERRVQMGNAAALYDWRSQLRAWREWRALVWAGRKEREAISMEEGLRSENRRCQLAMESDRRRLLKRCLSAWRTWGRAERRRLDLLNQQEETKLKMAALISAATSGKLGSSNTLPSVASPSPPSAAVQPETTPTQTKADQQGAKTSVSSLPRPPAAPDQPQAAQARAGTSGQTMCDAETLQQRVGSDLQRFFRKEECRKKGQRTVAEQGQRLRELSQLISALLEEQKVQKHKWKKPRIVRETNHDQSTRVTCPYPEGPVSSEGPAPSSGPRSVKPLGKALQSALKPASQPRPSPLVTAMEERARQRAERRRELQEMKRQKEEERQALMRAEEEKWQREKEEERRREAERMKERRKQEREREMERQQRAERERQLLDRAAEHYRRALLQHRGLMPLKRLLERSRAQNQLAVDHHRSSHQRWCFHVWHQYARESAAEKEARAARLYRHILLRGTLRSWLKMKECTFIQTAQAEQFYWTRILRNTFKALQDYLARERIAARDKEKQASEHWLRHLMQRCLRRWRDLPRVMREERAREERREQLRRRVTEILPDFRRTPAVEGSRDRFHSECNDRMLGGVYAGSAQDYELSSL